MEKRQEEPLMKERSPRASLTAGFQLYMGNFRRIFKSTWLAGLITSVIAGATGTVAFVYWPELVSRIFSNVATAWQYADQYRLLLIIIALLTVLSTVALAAFGGYGVALLRQHQAGGTLLPVQRHLHWEGSDMWRSVKALLFNGVLFCVSYGVVAAFAYWKRAMFLDPMHHIASLVLLALLFSIVSTVLLPTAYITTRYLFERKTHYTVLLITRYLTSLRFWGSQFVVLLVCFIVLGLLYLVASLPELILYEANWQARIGVVGGDPLGMPGYITLLTFVTCTLSSFMQLYIVLPLLFCLYYVYGSIDTREQRKQENQNIPLS